MRHILVMTASSTAGLLAIFVVDFINLYFLSLLGDVEITAAIGYASSILFFTISFGIGLSIGVSALIATALGRLDWRAAERLTVNLFTAAFLASAVFAGILCYLARDLLIALGAQGRTLELGCHYLWIIIPSTPLLVLGMCSAAALRSLGDARRSMYVTLFGAIANAILDPIFIFGLGLGVEGAAIATVLSRFVIAGAGLYGVSAVHGLVKSMRLNGFLSDARSAAAIAIPAVLTNFASPAANAYCTAAIASFGNEAVAAWAIIARLIPVAFAAIFALTGSIGPIIGQNAGNADFARVRQTLTESLKFTAAYTLIAWAVLAFFHPFIAQAFNAGGETAELIAFFCAWLTPAFAFLGALFVTNAAFNTLGRPQLSTLLNWGRATAGTVPFVMLGGELFGAKGVIAGSMAGAIIFGSLSVALCYRHIRKLQLQALPQLEIAAPAAR